MAYLKKAYKGISGNPNRKTYHPPLLVTLAHTVNVKMLDKEPDLRMFFTEMEKIGNGKVSTDLFERAKLELAEEFDKRDEYVYGAEKLSSKIVDELHNMTFQDVLREVYNTESPGSIEVIFNPKNSQEASYKLKTSDRPFALTRIGDIKTWLKERFTSDKYEIIEKWEDESVFVRLDESPDISILMGARTFYEGWDTNRPNIITFINIGVGLQSRKFVLQSIGRGARIEPLKNRRKRLSYILNMGDLEAEKIFADVDLDYVNALESLFIFGTKKRVIEEIITSIKEEKLKAGETVSLMRNPSAEMIDLLIPCYRELRKVPVEKIPKFTINKDSSTLLKNYIDWIGDDKKLLTLHFSESTLNVDDLIRFKNFIGNEDHFLLIDEEGAADPFLLIPQLIRHVDTFIEELEKFKKLENEIVHFKRIGVYLDEDKFEEFKERVEKVQGYSEKKRETEKLQQLYGKISMKEFMERMDEINRKYSEKERFEDIDIYYIAEHYYLPLLSTKEKVEWIRNIIQTESEYKFIKDLIEVLKEKDNPFTKFDWWMFSKIDEHLDEVYIPYYDSRYNTPRRFKPDFIFWLRKGNEYCILFVDPKGISYTEYQYKVDGYKEIFIIENNPKVFQQHGYKIRVYLQLYTEDVKRLQEGYREYWSDNITKTIKKLGS